MTVVPPQVKARHNIRFLRHIGLKLTVFPNLNAEFFNTRMEKVILQSLQMKWI